MAGKEIAKVFSARFIKENKDSPSNQEHKSFKGQLSKFIRIPNLKAHSFDRKTEICEMLDQILQGPVRKDTSQKSMSMSRRPSLSLKTPELTGTTQVPFKPQLAQTNGFRPFQKTNSSRPVEQTVSNDSTNPSPTHGSTSKEQKINIWGGSPHQESHKRGKSFDIMLR